VLEQVLMEVHAAHSDRRAIRAPETVNLTYPGPRESSVPPPKTSRPQEHEAEPDARKGDDRTSAPATPPPPPPPGTPQRNEEAARQRNGDDESHPETLSSPDDIDRVALAREFAQLLQENPRPVEEDPEA
jgi:hypothetical protein